MIGIKTGNIGNKINKFSQWGNSDTYQYDYQMGTVFIPPLPKLKNNEARRQKKAKQGKHGYCGKSSPCYVCQIMDTVFIKPIVFIDQVMDIGSPHEEGKKPGQKKQGRLNKENRQPDLAVTGYKKQGKGRYKTGAQIQNPDSGKSLSGAA
jgi:hypothetical protein